MKGSGIVGRTKRGGGLVVELDSVPDNLLSTLKAEEVDRERESQEREKRRKLSSLHSQKLLPQLQGSVDVRNAVARFFLAEGIPFSKVESYFFRQMVKKNRRTLSTTLTENVFKEVSYEVANSTMDKGPATLVADGWKTFSGDPVMAYLQCWVDISAYRASNNTAGERLTGQVVTEQAHSVITRTGKKNVCQFVTDSGSECKAARRLLPQMEGAGHILCAACDCHCMDLLLEDIFHQIPAATSKSNN